jgi:hypothetical protein
MVINSTGNVGIGTTNPGATLDVKGNIFAKSGVSSGKVLASLGSGAYVDYVMDDINGAGTGTNGIYIITATVYGNGAYYAYAWLYNWNPAVQTVTQIGSNGIGLAIAGNKLRVTNNTGAANQILLWSTLLGGLP